MTCEDNELFGACEALRHAIDEFIGARETRDGHTVTGLLALELLEVVEFGEFGRALAAVKDSIEFDQLGVA